MRGGCSKLTTRRCLRAGASSLLADIEQKLKDGVAGQKTVKAKWQVAFLKVRHMHKGLPDDFFPDVSDAAMAFVKTTRIKKWGHPGLSTPPNECLVWMTETEHDLKTGCSKWTITFSCGLLGGFLLAAVLSLGPIICPMGDPFDLTMRGYLNNTGYFLGYCGIGWSFLWATYALWAHRLLNIKMHWVGAVIIPTLICIAKVRAAAQASKQLSRFC
eukprot:SAG22_NODE_1820_length_3514_cov_2.304539_2_plen_215_part_00